MKPAFKDHFSQVSEAYRAFRPEYPEELFQWLAGIAPRRESALDCGCGTGQAAVALARHFGRVYAVDPSQEQIANATQDDKVTYIVAPAEETGLLQGSQDLIIAAQSLHWFAFDRFYAEIRRLAGPNAVFAAFTYGLVSVDSALDQVVGRLYCDILGRYWPPERRYVDEGYRTLPFPFRELEAPEFVMTANWSIERFLGYLATWSAVKEYRARTGEDPLRGASEELGAAWGQDELKTVSWPLVIRAGVVEPFGG